MNVYIIIIPPARSTVGNYTNKTFLSQDDAKKALTDYLVSDWELDPEYIIWSTYSGVLTTEVGSGIYQIKRYEVIE